jgi:hypothetical protein
MPNGPKPWRKKIEPILALAPPNSLKQLRSFIGFINFYKDYWKRGAHTMSPLTALTGLKSNKNFHNQWQNAQFKAFNAVKAMIARNVLLTYPNPNDPFDIETDALDYQLEAVIKQHGQPVAFFSRKLTGAQRNYTTIQKELLSIIKTLTTFRPILLLALSSTSGLTMPTSRIRTSRPNKFFVGDSISKNTLPQSIGKPVKTISKLICSPASRVSKEKVRTSNSSMKNCCWKATSTTLPMLTNSQ